MVRKKTMRAPQTSKCNNAWRQSSAANAAFIIKPNVSCATREHGTVRRTGGNSALRVLDAQLLVRLQLQHGKPLRNV